MVIQAFIKNFRERCIWCSLNVGLSGIIKDEESQKVLKEQYSIGDVIKVHVVSLDHPRGDVVVLKFINQSVTTTEITPPYKN
jgi:transcriptional accessory protein Tex/SPT6